MSKLENVAIANALQLEAARVTPVLSRFSYNVLPSLRLPYNSAFLLLIDYFTV